MSANHTDIKIPPWLQRYLIYIALIIVILLMCASGFLVYHSITDGISTLGSKRGGVRAYSFADSPLGFAWNISFMASSLIFLTWFLIKLIQMLRCR